MTQQVQELINKIKSEGVQAADQKAKEIEAAAKKKADEIIHEASREGSKVILEAQKEAKRLKETTQMALQQSSRDTLLSVKKEISGILHKIIVAHVGDALSPETLAKILETLVEKFAERESSSVDIRLALNAHDLKVLKEGYLAKLQKNLKQPLKLNPKHLIQTKKQESCFAFPKNNAPKQETV